MSSDDSAPQVRVVMKWSKGNHKTTVETIEKLREISERIHRLIEGLGNYDRRRETASNNAN